MSASTLMQWMLFISAFRILVLSKPVHVLVSPIESMAMNKSFPDIDFVGGLILKSKDKRFGGWSSLVSTEGGHNLTLLSDVGYWSNLEVHYEKGVPTNISNCIIEPVLDEKGKPLRKRHKTWSDAESVVQQDKNVSNSPLITSFEMHHRIRRYKDIYSDETTDDALSLSSRILNSNCDFNAGAEAIEVVSSKQEKKLLFFCEDSLMNFKNVIPGWVVGMNSSSVRPIYVKLKHEYHPTDLAAFNRDSVLVIQRMYDGKSTGMRLGIIPGHLIMSSSFSSVITPAPLLQIVKSPQSKIDNMEGLALSYINGTDGEILRITAISDDNFNRKQDTVLLTFEVRNISGLVDYGIERAKVEELRYDRDEDKVNWVLLFQFLAVFMAGFIIGTSMLLLILHCKSRTELVRYTNINTRETETMSQNASDHL